MSARLERRQEAEARERFKLKVCASPCVMCLAVGVDRRTRTARAIDLFTLEAHHVIKQQHLRRYGFGGREWLWDPRVGLCLCRYHHARHDHWVERVPRRLLRSDNWRFAEDVELVWLLERDFPLDTEGA